MGTKYSSNVSTDMTNYNASAPADDGTVAESNKIKWDHVKTKIGDIVKTAIETLDSRIVTHFDESAVSITTNTTIGTTHYHKVLVMSGSGTTLTLDNAATLGDGFSCFVIRNDASNNQTIDQTGSETINGSTSAYTLSTNYDAVKIYCDGTEFFITAFAVAKQQSFLAFNSTSTSLSTSFQIIDFDDVSTSPAFDTAGDFDTANNRYTPQVAGKYMFVFEAHFGSVPAGENVEMRILKNSTIALVNNAFNSPTTETLGWNTSIIVDMNGSTDYVECQARNVDSATGVISLANERTQFFGHRVSD